jgi:hypothetical protein
MDCGELAALSATASEALYVAAEAGAKVREMVQLAEGARVEPHVVDFAKAVGLVPPRVIEEMFSVAVPVLERVAV